MPPDLKPSERIHPAKADPAVNVFLLEILDELHEALTHLQEGHEKLVADYAKEISDLKKQVEEGERAIFYRYYEKRCGTITHFRRKLKFFNMSPY